MGRAKLPRKSTSIDMTAMCDVAFLLLSFFILTTKFKPDEALAVQTPNSVSSKTANEKKQTVITIDKEGKVYLSFSDDSPKKDVISGVNQLASLGLTDQEMKRFETLEFVGVPFSQVKSLLSKDPEALKGVTFPGIPCLDSSNNELKTWMAAVNNAFRGDKITLLLKGDNNSKYPSFKNVIAAFKANDFLKFQMVTNPASAPVGTDLYRSQQKGIKQQE
jgi:biopolymer transport protein ExbD